MTSEKGLENINEVQDCELNARFLPWAKVEGILADTSVRIGQSRGVFIKHELCQAECNILSFSMYVNAAHLSQSQPRHQSLSRDSPDQADALRHFGGFKLHLGLN